MRFHISHFTADPIALATGSTAMMSHGVVIRIFVSIFTMRLFSFLGHKTSASHNIFFLSHGLKVIRIHTGFISTQMIKHKAIWYGSIYQFIGHNVGPSTSIFGSRNMKHAISLGDCTKPNPTAIGLAYFFPKIYHGCINSIPSLAGQWRN